MEDGLDIWESAKEAARHQAEEPTKGLGGAGFLYRRYCRIVEEQRDIVGPTFGNVYVSRDEEIEWLLARLSRDRFLSPERALKAIESYSSKRQARGYVGGPYGGGHYGVSSKIGGVFDIYQRFVDIHNNFS